MADSSKPDEPKRNSLARDALKKTEETARQNLRENLDRLGRVEQEPERTGSTMAKLAELSQENERQVRDAGAALGHALRTKIPNPDKPRELKPRTEDDAWKKIMDDPDVQETARDYEAQRQATARILRGTRTPPPERSRMDDVLEDMQMRRQEELVERLEKLQQSASARRILNATRGQLPAEPAASEQSSPPQPLFRKRVHSWFQRYAGWAFVGASIGTAGIAEYAVAIGLLVVAFVAFAIQINEWSGHIQRRWLVGFVKGIWCLGVIGMLLFFGVAFYKMKASKPWSNLLAGNEAPPAASQHTPTPAAEVSESIADTPKPNIVPVSFGERHLRFDPATKTFMTADTGILALVAEFRNAHERGKEIVEGKDIRAHIYFEPFDYYKKLDKNIPGFAHVEEGIWLNEKSALVNFARGEAKTLVLVVELEPNGFGGFDAFDHSVRKNPDGSEVFLPRVPKVTANKYVVKVEITGGTKGEIAELYHFTITLRPKLTISFG